MSFSLKTTPFDIKIGKWLGQGSVNLSASEKKMKILLVRLVLEHQGFIRKEQATVVLKNDHFNFYPQLTLLSAAFVQAVPYGHPLNMFYSPWIVPQQPIVFYYYPHQLGKFMAVLRVDCFQSQQYSSF